MPNFVARVVRDKMSDSIHGHILVIDDEPLVRESLAVYLQDSGFDVDTASNGADGLALFRQADFDLIICDLRMPVLDGLDVLKTVTQEKPETPVIVVSGQGNMQDVVTALRNGAVDYLFKPLIEMEVLEHAVRRAIERGHLVKQNRQIREELERTNQQLQKSLASLEQDHEAGRRVQYRMLPNSPHTFNNSCVFTHRIIPSLYLSGDFIDYFRISEDRIGFYLADVSGHGASSAFVTVFLKSLMNRIRRHYEKRTAINAISPSRLFSAINDELLAMQIGKHLAMFSGVIDLSNNTLTYCIAAHFPPPALVCDGQVTILEGTGLPVGIFEHATFEDKVISLPEKFTLVAMSDGILEHIPEEGLDKKEAFMFAKLAQGFQSAEAVAEAFGLLGKQELPDDVAILVIDRK